MKRNTRVVWILCVCLWALSCLGCARNGNALAQYAPDEADRLREFFAEHQDKPALDITGIYRAKGNEAAMVYVINAHDCFQADDINMLNSDNAKIRNRLFTAMTRSKAWVRVVGIGSQMDDLKAEYEKVKEKSGVSMRHFFCFLVHATG